LRKKNALFLTMGPPTLKPKSCTRSRSLSMPAALLKKLVALNASFR